MKATLPLRLNCFSGRFPSIIGAARPKTVRQDVQIDLAIPVPAAMLVFDQK